jgi:Ca2+-binding RTX toxin-like protein
MADFTGGSGNDVFTGDDSSERIFGNGGDDTLSGAGGQDVVSGGAGADTVDGGAGNDIIGSAGITFTRLGLGMGKDIPDWDMGLEHDVLTGGADDDILAIGYGDDADGGTGYDRLYLSLGGLAAGTTFDTAVLYSGQPYVLGGGTIQNIDLLTDLRGTEYADLLILATQPVVPPYWDDLTVEAGAGDDEIRSGGSIYKILGGAGNDLLLSGTGADFFDGGAGIDTVSYAGASVGVNVSLGGVGFSGYGPGGDSLTNVENVVGSAFADYLFGSHTANVIDAGDGDDELIGNEGDDILKGGNGNDYLVGGTLIAEAGDDSYDGGAGIDTVDFSHEAGPVAVNLHPTLSLTIGSASSGHPYANGPLGPGQALDSVGNYESITGVENLIMTGGNEDVQGSDVANRIEARAGHDRVLAMGGDDVVFGGAGFDLIYGGEGNDTVEGGDNPDTIYGENGDDTLRGDAGDDLLDSGAGTDSLAGGAGNDILYFGAHFSAGDVADGGADRDAIVLQGNVTAVLTDTNMAGIESISVQSGATATYGDTANNRYDYNLTTSDGNVAEGQQLIVNAQSLLVGEDFIFDGSAETDGSFRIYGGHGVDLLTGGDGNDIFFFEGQRWGASDRVHGGDGRDSLVISAGGGVNHIEFVDDSFTSIESISLNNKFATDPTQKPSYELVLANGNVAAGATLIVNASSIAAGQFVSIDGTAVHDGNLRLFGGAGNDTLRGGDGADTLIGGGGADSLTGGAGADVFRFDAASDSTAGAADVIVGFQSGVDKVDLSRLDANSNAAGDQAFAWIGGAAFHGVAGELRAYDVGSTRWIEGDTDGDGDGDFAFMFQTVTPLEPGDFIL